MENIGYLKDSFYHKGKTESVNFNSRNEYEKAINLLNNFKKSAGTIDLPRAVTPSGKLNAKDTTFQKSTANISLNKSRNKEILIENYEGDEQRNTYSNAHYQRTQTTLEGGERYKSKDPKKKQSPSPNYSIDFEKYRLTVLEKLNKKAIPSNIQGPSGGVGVIKTTSSALTANKTFKKIDEKKTMLYKK
jgi:hypothetical protein